MTLFETLSPAITLICVPVLRSVAGWATKAFEDGKITEFEWKLLGSTVIRVSMISTAAYYSLNFAGIDIPAISAALSAIILDKLIESVKKSRK